MKQMKESRRPKPSTGRSKRKEVNMRIAITGGRGFIGSHLANRLYSEGHEVVLIARRWREEETTEVFSPMKFVTSDLGKATILGEAVAGCDAVAHCAGINREIGKQTYQRVHVEATRNVVDVAHAAGVRKIVLMSFLRARPNCGSPYHESKWAAEEIVRSSGLDYTIIKAGMVYGRGDHMLDHLSPAIHTFPLFAMVGLKEKTIRPLAVEDLVHVMRASLVDDRLKRQTIALLGPEEIYLSEAVRRVAEVVGRRPLLFPMPGGFHYLLARGFELPMKIPLTSLAQVRLLAVGVVTPGPPVLPVPNDVQPT